MLLKSLKFFFAVCSSIVLVFALGASQSEADDSITQTFDRDTAWNKSYSKGMALFEENCASCHGSDGKGGTGDAIGLPLNLQSFLTVAPKEYIKKTITFGRPSRGMPSFAGDLKEGDIDAIATYVKGWQFRPTRNVSDGPINGDPFEGEKLYRGLCASCHGLNAEGGPLDTGGSVVESFSGFSAPSLADAGFKKSATDGFVKATLVYGRQGTPMSSFIKGSQGIAELSESEIDSLVSYVRSVPSIME